MAAVRHATDIDLWAEQPTIRARREKWASTGMVIELDETVRIAGTPDDIRRLLKAIDRHVANVEGFMRDRGVLR